MRAIDVRHDLAIVEAVGFAPAPLELKADTIKGERAYSIGFPLDVGLTITEGVSNGRVEDSFQPRIHYSGALNAGMSGGPGLDSSGHVIGVNVAGYFLSQLVAFFVPAEYAITLLASSTKAPLDAKRARDEVAGQLRAHSEALLAALDTPLVMQAHQGYELPGKLAGFVDCRAAGDPAPDQPVQVERVICDAKSTLYIASDLNSGGLSFRHQVLNTNTLDAWRFAHRLQEASAPLGGQFKFGRNRQLAPYACKQDDVALEGLEANAIVCLRAYRKFDGLYDLQRAHRQQEPGEARLRLDALADRRVVRHRACVRENLSCGDSMETVIVIDVLAAHDKVRARHRIERPGETASCTIGRGAAADVVLDDPHVAAVHARVTVNAAGEVTVTDLGSVNGIEIRRSPCSRRPGRAAHRRDHSDRPYATACAYGAGNPSRRNFRSDGFSAGNAQTRFPVARDRFCGDVGEPGVLGLDRDCAAPRARDGDDHHAAGPHGHRRRLDRAVGAGEPRCLWRSRAGCGMRRSSSACWRRSNSCRRSSTSSAPHPASICRHSPPCGLSESPPRPRWRSTSSSGSPMQPRYAIAIGVLIPAIVLGAAQWTMTHSQNRSANYIPDRNEIVPPALALRGGEPLEAFVTGLRDLKAQADAKRAFVEKEDPAPTDDSSDDNS